MGMIERPVDPIRARAMQRLQWHDPKQVLVNLRRIELQLSPDINERVRRLRTNQLKEWREARIAAIFAFGFAQTVLGHEVAVAKTEEMDYDFIMRWRLDNKDFFYPVQLKELPPDDLNSEVTLEDIFDKVERYSGESDLSIAIHVNRAMRLEYRHWDRQSNPRIGELWLFGALSPDHSKWFLYGNMLHRVPGFREFEYPSSA